MIQETLDDLSMDNSQFIVTDQAKKFLFETAKWAKLLAIMGIIGIGIMVIMGLGMSFFMTTMMGDLPSNSMPAGFGAGIGFLYVILAAVYAVPVYYLLKFANTTKAALRIDDAQVLTQALGYLKSHYKFIGIMTIVLLALSILPMIFMMIFGAGMAAMG